MKKLSKPCRASSVFCTNCDWLAFSVTIISRPDESVGEWLFCAPVGFRVVELGGTNIYARRLFVLNDAGDKFLTILCKPLSPVIPPSSALVEVANQHLYYSRAWVMGFLYKLHPCAFLCLSRFDVCADFNPTADGLGLIRRLAAGTAYIQGKRAGSQFHTFCNVTGGVDRVAHCLSWGSPYSLVKCKLYNKTKEIFDILPSGETVCSKPWIVESWERSGLTHGDVWRIEFSITHASGFQFRGRQLVLDDCILDSVCADLWYSLYMTRFVIRENEAHKDRSNDTRSFLVSPLEEEFAWPYVARLRKVEPKSERVSPEFVGVIRSLVAQLDKVEVKANIPVYQSLCRSVAEVVAGGGLGLWFYRCFGASPFYPDICKVSRLIPTSSSACTYDRWRLGRDMSANQDFDNQQSPEPANG